MKYVFGLDLRTRLENFSFGMTLRSVLGPGDPAGVPQGYAGAIGNYHFSSNGGLYIGTRLAFVFGQSRTGSPSVTAFAFGLGGQVGFAFPVAERWAIVPEVFLLVPTGSITPLIGASLGLDWKL